MARGRTWSIKGRPRHALFFGVAPLACARLHLVVVREATFAFMRGRRGPAAGGRCRVVGGIRGRRGRARCLTPRPDICSGQSRRCSSGCSRLAKARESHGVASNTHLAREDTHRHGALESFFADDTERPVCSLATEVHLDGTAVSAAVYNRTDGACLFVCVCVCVRECARAYVCVSVPRGHPTSQAGGRWATFPLFMGIRAAMAGRGRGRRNRWRVMAAALAS